MSTSKTRKERPAPNAEGGRPEEPQAGVYLNRDAQGRFVPGNPGGPGNPFARRVAELRKVLLDCVTKEEMEIVAGQLMVKAKFGDLAAIKLLFQYVLGKPAATVDPDSLDLQEIELFRRGPDLRVMNEIVGTRMTAELAATLLRTAMPHVSRGQADMMYDAIIDPEAFAAETERLRALDAGEDDDCDDEDFEEEEVAAQERQPAAAAVGEPAPRVQAAPSANGKTSVDPRRRATRPSANGESPKANPPGPPPGNGDDGRHSSRPRRPDRRPPRGK